MRIAIVSDIHGNLDAFEQVLADIDRSDIDEIISLGDNIGYGPEPDNELFLKSGPQFQAQIQGFAIHVH